MALKFTDVDDHDLSARIAVFGVGGAGGNAINNMIEKQLAGVEFVAANTDAQALGNSRAERRIQLGQGVTRGLGAGSKPEVGQSSAEESTDEIAAALDGCHMCFITGGMGGGTGTGAAPVVARVAREMGILTVGVVTKPFQFEGARRMRLAEAGVAEMQQFVDTLIVIPNQNLFQVASERTTFVEAFQLADDVLYQGVQGVTDLMVRPGMINLDFADVRSVMEEMGKAMMGTGEADGDTRAIDAAEKAIANPLLDEVSLKGAKGVLINITGGYDLTLFEMDEAANRIKNEVDADALIKFGSAIDPDMDGKMRVSVVATGIDAEMQAARPPQVENHAPRRRPALTEAAGVDALRSGQQRQAGEPAYRAAPEAAVPEAEAPVANPAPRAEPSAPTADPIESRVASTPTPAEIRARADRVRESALASRANREAARQARPAFDDDAVAPALFDLDDGSIDPAHRGAMGDADPRGDHPRAHPLGRGMFRGEASDTAPVHPPAHPPAHPPVHPPAPAQAHTPAPAPEQPQRGGMFTINRLINRGARAVAPPAPQARTEPRYDPRMEAAEDDHDDADVPAFLRRQAN